MWIKICGITSERDAELAIEAGADAIGLNFVGSSARFVDRAAARAIARLARNRVELVGVVADLEVGAMEALRDELGLAFLQLHGDERPETLRALLPGAFKALRVGDAADVALAEHFPGARLLVDAKVAGQLGGTGQRVDPSLVRDLARSRSLILAGGLAPENVEAAIVAIGPFGVDVASGVERPGCPREKDPDRVRAFVERARNAPRWQSGA